MEVYSRAMRILGGAPACGVVAGRWTREERCAESGSDEAAATRGRWQSSYMGERRLCNLVHRALEGMFEEGVCATVTAQSLTSE